MTLGQESVFTMKTAEGARRLIAAVANAQAKGLTNV